MIRRSARAATVLLAALLAVAGVAGSAFAQYPPLTGVAVVDRTEVEVGETVLFGGSGCAPGSEVLINDGDETVATTIADEQGNYSVPVPITSEGPHVLSGTCLTPTGQALVLSATVTGIVTESPEPQTPGPSGPPRSGGKLPRTGTQAIVPSLLLGFAGVVAGSGIVFAARRRSRSVTA